MQYTPSQDVKDLMNMVNSTDLNQMSRKHANTIILSDFTHHWQPKEKGLIYKKRIRLPPNLEW